MADEVHRLIVQAVGDEEQKRLQLAVDAAKAALEAEVTAALKVSPAFAQASTGVKQLATDVARAEASLKAHEVAMARSGAGSSRLTQSISTLSFSLNDAEQFSAGFTQGMRAISNNIPGLIAATQNLSEVGFKGVIAALSGPTGIILALATVSAAIPLVSAHWGELQDLWIGGETSTEAERMEKLGKATKLTADETDRLNKFNREKAVGQALEGGESKATVEARKAVQEAVPELPGGFDALRDALVSARNPQGLSNRITEEDRVKIQDIRLNVQRAENNERFILDFTGFRGATGEELIQFREEFEQAREKAFGPARQAERDRATETIVKTIASPERLPELIHELRRAGREDLAIPIEEAPSKKEREKDANKDQNILDSLHKAARDIEADDAKQRLKEAEDHKNTLFNLHNAIQEVEQADAKERLKSAKEQGADIVAKAASAKGVSKDEVARFLESRGIDRQSAATLAGEGATTAERDRVNEAFNPKQRSSNITDSIIADIQKGVGSPDAQKELVEVNKKQLTALEIIAKGGKVDQYGRAIIQRKYF